MVVPTNRRRLHRAEASGQRPASPSGTAQERPGRSEPQEVRGRQQRRIPAIKKLANLWYLLFRG